MKNKSLFQRNRSGMLPVGVLVVVAILIGGAITFVYTKNKGSFSGPNSTKELTAAELLQKAFAKVSDIQSASYASVFSVASQPRDAGATPFKTDLPQGNFINLLPGNANITLRASGTTQTAQAQATDARFQIGADITFEDFTMNADIEFSKKGDAYYVRINKFPSLLPTISSLKGKWVKILPEDLKHINAGGLTFSFKGGTGGNNAPVLPQLQLFFKIAGEESVVAIDGEPAKESVNGKDTYHYRLAFAREKLPRFLERLVDESQKQFGDKSFVKSNASNEETSAYLQSKEFNDALDYMDKNLSLELWVDRATGFPVKLASRLKVIPSDAAVKAKNMQYLLAETLTIGNINEQTAIEVPQNFITFSEAQRLLNGGK